VIVRTLVAVVPHTHWDREWYQPFEGFRARLIPVLDGLLDTMEEDPAFSDFLLDGQLAVVDDYLGVRPDAVERIRRLVASGRMSVGPWYTLPDEFCVSGETLVRDLQLGQARAAAIGGSMPVGYLPDMFGHIAQMPQLLRLAGFDRAVVWRGVPAAVDASRFHWVAPDGSSVLAEYLWDGYGNGATVADDPAALVERLHNIRAELGDRARSGLLFMNGTDHERPQPWLARVAAAAEKLDPDLDIRIGGLAASLAAIADATEVSWKGELRSGARANLLMGVLSNRVDVKQAAAAAERALERVAEPLAALWLDEWPSTLLDDAWLQVVRNAAHDSCCACSADEVCEAVLGRYTSARETAYGIAGAATLAIAALPAEPTIAIINPTARTRDGVVELDFPGTGMAPGAQLLEERPGVITDELLDLDDALAWLSGWRGQRIDAGTYLERVDIAESDDLVELTLHGRNQLVTNLLVPPIRDDVAARLQARPGRRLHLRILQPEGRRLACYVHQVPGFGWARWRPAAPPDPVRVEDGVLTNGLVSIAAEDGAFSINGASGFGRLVESGDLGDTYNYCPPDHDDVVDQPSRVELSVVEPGPVRGTLRITAIYDWPSHADEAGGRRIGSVPTEVVTDVELRAGEPWARVSHRWDNRSQDHRVRALLPLPAPASVSEAECAFAIVTRGLHAEGGPTERALATFPSRRFVRAGGLTLVHDGLLEFELTADGGVEVTPDALTASTLALTLLRGTGILSRVDHPYRPLPAGPPLPLPAAQLPGPRSFRYAVALADVDPYDMADRVLVPLMTTDAPGGGPVASAWTQALAIEGAEVSALRRDGDSLLLRVHNPTPAPAVAHTPGRSGWVVDLRGRPLRPFDDRVELGAWEIATLRFSAATAPRPPAR
jgi:mannosylglycerate hydrolase